MIVSRSDAVSVGGASRTSQKLPNVLRSRVPPTSTKPLATTWAATLVANIRTFAAMARKAILFNQ